MIRMVCLLLIACSLDGSHGQTEPPKLKPFWAIRLPEGSQVLPVPGRDACYGAVAREMARAKEDCARRGIAELVIHGPPWEIKGPALGKLFPNHRFFVFVWSQRAKEPLPPNTPRPVGLLVAAHTSIAIDKGGLVDKLGHDGCIELSADFLAKNRVKVRNGDDARLVWDALCEIYRRDRKGEIEKVSDHLWRLGIEKTDRGRTYQEVRLNEDFTVKAMKFVSEKSP